MKLQQLRQIIREEVKMTLAENKGSLVTATGNKIEEINSYVKDLETYLIKIGEENDIEWDWEKLGELLINIISEARGNPYDDKHF
jgi:hypothetical protein